MKVNHCPENVTRTAEYVARISPLDVFVIANLFCIICRKKINMNPHLFFMADLQGFYKKNTTSLDKSPLLTNLSEMCILPLFLKNRLCVKIENCNCQCSKSIALYSIII